MNQERKRKDDWLKMLTTRFSPRLSRAWQNGEQTIGMVILHPEEVRKIQMENWALRRKLGLPEKEE